MAGFRSVKKYTDAWEEGRSYTSHFRKAFGTSSAAWQDWSMQTGGPPAQYYAASPLAAAALTGSRGIYHGDDKAPARKYLTHMSLVASALGVTGVTTLCDYVLYYPFIDCGDLTEQVMDNTITLPRYTDGEGLKVMAVQLTATQPTGGIFTFNYVNQDGDSVTSPTNTLPAFGGTLSVGSLLSGIINLDGSGPFLLIRPQDSGIRAINSVTFTSPNAGLMALSIVRPLLTINSREVGCEAEVEAITSYSTPVEIKDGAYLNLIHLPTQALGTSFLTGKLQFIWDEGT
jgi:hypothetical protein